MPAAGLTPLDTILFVVMPYLAMGLFLVGTIVRYRKRPFSFSSLSSQFLENRAHFWAEVPFHYGILFVLAGHVVAFLFPRSLLAWNGEPIRLYVLEITALAGGALAIVGLLNIVTRRLTDVRARVVTSPMDWVVYALLFLQLGTGVYIATSSPWGSSWFATVLTPYLRSLCVLSPDATGVAALPAGWALKTHVACLWALLGVFPFTRLVHVLVVPNPYLWRRPQVVRWYGIRRAGRSEA